MGAGVEQEARQQRIHVGDGGIGEQRAAKKRRAEASLFTRSLNMRNGRKPTA